MNQPSFTLIQFALLLFACCSFVICLWQTKNVGYGTPFMHAQLGHYIEKATC